MQDFVQTDKFKSVLPDGQPQDASEPKAIRKVYICTGQVYYELVEKRKAANRKVELLLTTGYRLHPP